MLFSAWSHANVLVRMLFIWFKFFYAVDLLTITSSHLTMLFWKSKWNFYHLLLGYKQHVNSHLMCGWSVSLNMFHCIHFITDWLNWFSKSYICHVCVLWQVQWFRNGEVWHHLGHWGVLSKLLLNPAEIQNDTYPKQSPSLTDSGMYLFVCFPPPRLYMPSQFRVVPL